MDNVLCVEQYSAMVYGLTFIQKGRDYETFGGLISVGVRKWIGALKLFV